MSYRISKPMHPRTGLIKNVFPFNISYLINLSEERGDDPEAMPLLDVTTSVTWKWRPRIYYLNTRHAYVRKGCFIYKMLDSAGADSRMILFAYIACIILRIFNCKQWNNNNKKMTNSLLDFLPPPGAGVKKFCDGVLSFARRTEHIFFGFMKARPFTLNKYV